MPSTATISRDEFLEATTDLWGDSAESATRGWSSAPFPVAIPRRLIELYYLEGMSSSIPSWDREHCCRGPEDAKALPRLRYRQSYVARAKARIAEEAERLERQDALATPPFRYSFPPCRPPTTAKTFRLEPYAKVDKRRS